MKRIQYACLCETSKFENEADLVAYIEKMSKKSAKFEVINKVIESDGSVTVETKSQYLNYKTGKYIE